LWFTLGRWRDVFEEKCWNGERKVCRLARAVRENKLSGDFGCGDPMAKKKSSAGEHASENPAPSLPSYESFHVTANKELSKRFANILTEAGIRINETVWHVIGRPEYVIEIHKEDIVRAEEAFAKDLGPGRTVTSEGSDPVDGS
jgi:hypothetical protein